MTTYGPLLPGRIHEVVIYPLRHPDFYTLPDYPGIPDGIGLEYLSGQAMPGWGFAHPGYTDEATPEAHTGWAASGSDEDEWPGAIPDCVFNHSTQGSPGTVWNGFTHTCTPITPATGNMADRDGAGWEYRGGSFSGSGFGATWSTWAESTPLSFRLDEGDAAWGVAPDGSEWPVGVVGVDIGSFEDYRVRTVLDCTVNGWNEVPTFDMRIKDAGDPGESWLDTRYILEVEASVPDPREGTIPEAMPYIPMPSIFDAGYGLDVAAMNDVSADFWVQDINTQIQNVLYPRFGMFPNPAEIDMPDPDSHVVSEVTEQEWTVTLRFQTAPYRYIYDAVGAPPQRVFPRADGLLSSSGARTYPRAKSRQASPRVVGGYL